MSGLQLRATNTEREWLRVLRGDRLVREVAADAGMSVGAICNLELGRRNPKLPTILRLAPAYGVDAMWLVEHFAAETAPSERTREPQEGDHGV